MKDLIRILFSDRVFQIVFVVCLLVLVGLYAVAQLHRAPSILFCGTYIASPTDSSSTGSPSLLGQLRRLVRSYTGPRERELSADQLERLDAFVIHLYDDFENGKITRKQRRDLYKRKLAELETEGLSAWEAAQYHYIHASAPMDYLKELADQALAEDPDDPERLYFWARRHPYVRDGPNPEREAVFEKLVAMEGLPPKLRSEILGNFADTIWYYRPEEALGYQREAAKLSKDSFVDLMGDTYQCLGQYDKALAIYRDFYAKTHDWEAAQHIKAIEAGSPLIPVIERSVTETPPSATVTIPHEISFTQLIQEWVSRSPAAVGPPHLEIASELRSHDSQNEVQDISKNRLRTAMRTLERYGPDIALRRLLGTDPRLAREIEKRLKNTSTQRR